MIISTLFCCFYKHHVRSVTQWPTPPFLFPRFSPISRRIAATRATSTRSSPRWQWSSLQPINSSSWIWTRTSSKAFPTPTRSSSFRCNLRSVIGSSSAVFPSSLSWPTRSPQTRRTKRVNDDVHNLHENVLSSPWEYPTSSNSGPIKRQILANILQKYDLYHF